MVDKDFSTARNKLRRILEDSASEETKPRTIRLRSKYSENQLVEDDGVTADPIPGLRPEPVYVEK